MLKFLGYMLFSGIEYLAIFFLIFGFFNMKLSHYIKEIALAVISSTFVSYLLVIFELHEIIPLPLLLIPLTVLLLTKVFGEKLKRSIITSISGWLLYAFVQFAVATLSLKAGLLTAVDLGNSFSLEAYAFQTICSLIAITIGTYVKLSNGGFGFTLSKKKFRYKTFLYTSIALAILCCIFCLTVYMYQSIAIVIFTFSVILVSISIIFYLSYKRDQLEFS